MRLSHTFRTALIALIAVTGASLSSAALADSGSIRIKIIKAGWFVGGSGGSGTLTFHGKSYPLSVGGISGGLVFGASATNLHGSVSNIKRPSDVSGVYAAGGAGAAFGLGARAIVLKNGKGAVLKLTGEQVGLMANLDLTGLAISLK